MTPPDLNDARPEDEGSTTTDERTPGRTGRPGGRPKKTASEVRRFQVHVFLTAAEKARVQGLAGAGGLSVSEFARRRMLSRPVVPRVDADAERQLRRIGVNLNQLARAANAAGQVEHRSDLDAVVAELRRTMAGIRGGAPPPPDP